MSRALVGAAALAAGFLAGPAGADIVFVDVPGGVAGLARATGIGDGTVTAEEPGEILVRARDGTHFCLVLTSGAPRLGAAAPPPPAATAADMLPDGEVTQGTHDVRRAWLARPTTRYRHGILGDAVEAAELRVERFDGRIFRYVLDGGSVFEDRRARLVDLDGDDFDEIIVVQS